MANRATVAPEQLARFDPVSHLTPDQIAELATQTPVESAAAGTVLFRAGEANGKAVFLLEGQVRLSAGPEGESVVAANTATALKQLDTNQPCRYSATAATAVKWVAVDRELLQAMIVWGQLATPEPEVIMSEDGIFTVDKGSWLKKMIKSPTFKNLPPANIEQLLDKLEPIKVRAGQIIIRQGDKGDYFYMIDQGTALVTRQTEEGEDESIEVAELAEGTSFGEAALISDKPRNATISMNTDGILLRLSKDDFLKLLTAPNVQWISIADAVKAVGSGRAVWLDIRLPKEFASGHIKGATNIPVQQLHRRARDLDKAKHYICYCDTGQRSSAASFILKQYGLTAFVLKNGIAGIPPEQLAKST